MVSPILTHNTDLCDQMASSNDLLFLSLSAIFHGVLSLCPPAVLVPFFFHSYYSSPLKTITNPLTGNPSGLLPVPRSVTHLRSMVLLTACSRHSLEVGSLTTHQNALCFSLMFHSGSPSSSSSSMLFLSSCHTHFSLCHPLKRSSHLTCVLCPLFPCNGLTYFSEIVTAYRFSLGFLLHHLMETSPRL